MRIHHINCGTSRPRGARLLNGEGGFFEPARMVCHCLLIEGNDGLVQAQIIAFAHDYQLVMLFVLCTIPLALLIGSTKATLRKQAAGPEHAVIE